MFNHHYNGDVGGSPYANQIYVIVYGDCLLET